MPIAHRYRLLASLACALLAPAAHAEDWFVVSGASYHFERRDEFRSDNPGIGWERPDPEIPLVYAVGYYRNSYDRDTFYAGARWEPLRWQYASLGIFAAFASGYWTPVVALPMLSLQYERVGINFVAAPTIRDYVGYVGAQVKVRFD
ncbi:hypothetical protein OPU71_06460 [Niveibacterium sp. 24ML]|uniref:hypothetical protein n=1 Tax=Niveibacterium sp. 24ML TaxID=2985512 RepID=UPI00226F7F94|nr:hypothetical protein [Niveibacterium sp. 24ML]MCX9155767.1 hypothetical protein [Niveibacterium sp. 24ML]